MDEDTIQDFKQFITSTVSRQISEVRDDIKNLDNKLCSKIDELSTSVAEAIESTNESTDTQLNNHKQRIIRLEQKAF